MIGVRLSSDSPCGIFNSNTSIVMRIAKTPSLNASSRNFFMPKLKLIRSSYPNATKAQSRSHVSQLILKHQLTSSMVKSEYACDRHLACVPTDAVIGSPTPRNENHAKKLIDRLKLDEFQKFQAVISTIAGQKFAFLKKQGRTK